MSRNSTKIQVFWQNVFQTKEKTP